MGVDWFHLVFCCISLSPNANLCEANHTTIFKVVLFDEPECVEGGREILEGVAGIL